MGRESLKLREPFDEFYAKEFHGAKNGNLGKSIGQKGGGQPQKRGFELMLATNSPVSGSGREYQAVPGWGFPIRFFLCYHL